MSTRRIACLSLTLIMTIANAIAATHDGTWRMQWYGIARAANLTSYMFQLLTFLVSIRTRMHQRGYIEHMRELAIEVGK